MLWKVCSYHTSSQASLMLQDIVTLIICTDMLTLQNYKTRRLTACVNDFLNVMSLHGNGVVLVVLVK